jgi:hypothetical protein
MVMSRRRVESPVSRTIGAAAMLLGIIGLVLFVYADRASNHPLRLAAVLVMTLALGVGMVVILRRNARVKTALGKRW